MFVRKRRFLQQSAELPLRRRVPQHRLTWRMTLPPRNGA
jgi:hypothetical protein